jgi:hypothetical protein
LINSILSTPNRFELVTGEHELLFSLSPSDAKECALIAVNKLIESHLLLTTTHEPEPSIRCKRYWQQVKQEIEKL